jgi:hypothetical protein
MILIPFCALLYCNGDVDSAPPQRRAIAELRRLASRPYSRNELKSMALLLCFMAGMPGEEQQGVSSTLVAANNFFR